MRWLWILAPLALLVPLAARAQDGPRLDAEMPEGEVIVGQPLTLRVKLLVPTWMPKPPVWPTLEVPSLLVRLPERASTPISETIDGETWSGISRAYRLYPLEVGAYEIPGQTLVVTYADPGKPDPIITDLPLEAIRFTAVLPAGAEGLDPAIVASGLKLEQQIDGGPDLVTGDAVTRIVSVTIAGTTPILLPVLTPVLEPGLTPGLAPESSPASGPPPLRAYPKEPVVSEQEQRGVLSGSRVETTTYVAQGGGVVDLAPISLNWFNLETGKVETASLEGPSFTVTAPPPPPPGPADYALWAAMGLGGLGLIWGFARLVWPRLRRLQLRFVSAWQASERFAHRRVAGALKARELNATYAALDKWSGFYAPLDPRDLAQMSGALAGIGAAQYGKAGPAIEKPDWRDAGRAYFNLRKNARSRRKARKTGGILPVLNPSAQGNPTIRVGPQVDTIQESK